MTSYNFFTQNKEWNLYNGATREFVNLFGIPCRYMKRSNINIDYLFGEDNGLSEYNDFVSVKLYLEDMTSFGGSGDIFSKFGLNMDDQITFLVNQNEIVEKLGVMPLSGDLIAIFEENRDIFEVTHVEDKVVLYPFGKNTSFKIFCKKFHYGHEIMNTGLTDIDLMNSLTNTTITVGTSVTGSLSAATVTAQHQTPINVKYLDFSEDDPYKDI